MGRHAAPDSPWPARVGGLWARLYENSLLLVMGTVFLASWAMQSLNNWRAFNEEQVAHDEAVVSWGSYLVRADFWERTLENWQSEFLAVGSARGLLDLSAPARVARVEACRGAARRDRLVRLTPDEASLARGSGRRGMAPASVSDLLRGVGVRQ